MTESGKKWLIGCGVGCLLVVILAAATCGGGALFLRNLIRDFERSESRVGEVRERFGPPSEYCPEADGSIPSSRIDAFLAAREHMAPIREEMEATLLALAGDRDESGKRSGPLGKVRAGLGLLPAIARYIEHRNEAFLAAGMGPGEYRYLYAISYYSWLIRSPADGPPFRLVGDSHDDGPPGGHADPDEVREERLERNLRRANRELLPALRCQLRGLEGAGSADAAWRAALEAEILAMEGDEFRLPWSEGVPPAVARSLEPFRERLEASYSPLCNALELAVGSF